MTWDRDRRRYVHARQGVELENICMHDFVLSCCLLLRFFSTAFESSSSSFGLCILAFMSLFAVPSGNRNMGAASLMWFATETIVSFTVLATIGI